MSFQYVSGNPDNLVGGNDAAMIDIQGPFNDIKAFLNQPALERWPPAHDLLERLEALEARVRELESRQ